MTETRIRVARDTRGGRVRMTIGSQGPRGRGHLGIRVLDAAPDRARVAVVAEGALLVAGDEIRLDFTVGPGVTLEVVEPAGTVAYDMRGGDARWAVTVDLGELARLVWRAEPFVISSGARVQRTLDLSLDVGARAVLRETLVFGRSAESGGVLRQRVRASGPGGPILAEDLDLDGAHPRPGVLAGARVVDTVTVLGRRATGIPTPDAAHRLELEAEGTLLRAFVSAAHLSPLDPTWDAAAGVNLNQRQMGREPAREAARARGLWLICRAV